MSQEHSVTEKTLRDAMLIDLSQRLAATTHTQPFHCATNARQAFVELPDLFRDGGRLVEGWFVIETDGCWLLSTSTTRRWAKPFKWVYQGKALTMENRCILSVFFLPQRRFPGDPRCLFRGGSRLVVISPLEDSYGFYRLIRLFFCTLSVESNPKLL